MKRKILIIGGLGFIGKNLYLSLVNENYSVTILTNSVNDTGDGFLTPAIRQNIVVGNILDREFIEKALIGYEVIFSLAGSSGASDSIKYPHKDLDINLRGHLNILETCRKINPEALLIFPSSRLVYGKPQKDLVDENHRIDPESIYAIHKLTTEHYYMLYSKLYGINCIIFRISNPYGPYQQFGSNNYGILNWFIHKSVNSEEIEIYGDGSQIRDFIYIDDMVRLFKISIESKKMFGKIFNVGSGLGISIKQVAEVIAEYVPSTKISFKPWPKIDKQIETGNYISDVSLLRNEIGWQPEISLDEGIRETVKFYEREVK